MKETWQFSLLLSEKLTEQNGVGTVRSAVKSIIFDAMACIDIIICALWKKQAAILFFEHTKISHTPIGMGSAALAAAARREGDPNFPQVINEMFI